MLLDEYDELSAIGDEKRWDRAIRNCFVVSVTLLIFAVGSCCAFGQISITESKVSYWIFDGATIVGGQIVAPVNAKPKFDRTETTIEVKTAIDYKFGQLNARRLPDYEKVTLDLVEKNKYRFKPSAPEGKYKLEYIAFDPEKGIASDEATVVLERSTPTPVEPVEPSDLPVLTKEARRAMQGLAAGMAADMDKAAEAVEKGQVKTVLDLAAFTVPLDVETRNVFKKSMAGPLEKSLGRDKLEPVNAKALREVAAGFRSVK